MAKHGVAFIVKQSEVTLDRHKYNVLLSDVTYNSKDVNQIFSQSSSQSNLIGFDKENGSQCQCRSEILV